MYNANRKRHSSLLQVLGTLILSLSALLRMPYRARRIWSGTVIVLEH